jgi:uncharacterized membrane protein
MEHTRGTGTIGLLAGVAAVAGGIALKRKIDNRRKGGSDDAPRYTRKKPDADHEPVGRTVTIRKGRDELYRFWRDFGNLPRFLENVEEVRKEGAHDVWVIKAPAGNTVEVKTKVTEDVDGEKIAWRSVESSDVEAHGEVTFTDAPGERGTRVSLRMSYDPPGGAVGRLVAKAFMREPEVQARHDLKRLKMLMETGEIATSARRKENTREAQQQEMAA